MSDQYNSWLEGMGVTWFKANPGAVSGAPGGAGKPKELTDSDFPTDAKQRKKADEEARKKGQELTRKKDSASGDGPPKDEDDSIAEAVKDKAKELFDKGREKLKLPSFSKEEDKKPEDAAPLVRFFKDMESGTEMYAKYVEYIKKSLDRAAKLGDLAGANRIAEASKGMSKIAGQLKSGLGRVGKVIQKARRMVEWIEAAREFAEASKNMQAGNPQTVDDWIGSLKELWDATMPFKEELEDKWWEAALEGSEAAAVAAPAMATLAIVGAQLYVAINLLDQGVKNERAYFERLKKATQTDEERAAEANREPAPDYPGDWETSEEEENRQKLRQEYNRNAAVQYAKERKTQNATEEFEKDVFPKIYMAKRLEIWGRIVLALRKAGSSGMAQGDSPESKWLDHFLLSGREGVYDEQAGIDIVPISKNISLEGARTEIGNFQSEPRCPFFEQLHDTALKKHLAGASKTEPSKR